MSPRAWTTLLAVFLSASLLACGQTPNGPAGDNASGKATAIEQTSGVAGAWIVPADDYYLFHSFLFLILNTDQTFQCFQTYISGGVVDYTGHPLETGTWSVRGYRLELRLRTATDRYEESFFTGLGFVDRTDIGYPRYTVFAPGDVIASTYSTSGSTLTLNVLKSGKIEEPRTVTFVRVQTF